MRTPLHCERTTDKHKESPRTDPHNADVTHQRRALERQRAARPEVRPNLLDVSDLPRGAEHHRVPGVVLRSPGKRLAVVEDVGRDVDPAIGLSAKQLLSGGARCEERDKREGHEKRTACRHDWASGGEVGG